MCVVFCFYFWFAYVCGVVFNLFFYGEAGRPGPFYFCILYVFC